MKPTLLVIWSFATCVLAHEHHNEYSTSNILHAAYELIGQQSEDSGQLVFPFEMNKRESIDYFPLVYHRDAGVSLRDMSTDAVLASHTLLQHLLSDTGYLRIQQIQSLEDDLRNGAPESGSNRLVDHYAMQIFGSPSNTDPWAVKYEGHHLSLNFTFLQDKIRGTPLFLGANPAEVFSGPRKGLRVLDVQQSLGIQLKKSLTAFQQKKAIHSNRSFKQLPRGVLPEVNRFEGLSTSEMTPEQRTLLRSIAESFAKLVHPMVFQEEMQRYNNTDPSLIYFLWQDNGNPVEECYYRIHAPELLIEFSLFDGNHIHALWRNPKRDFGKDLLREHLQNGHEN